MTAQHGDGLLRVAVVGSGPAAFYVVEHLLARRPGAVSVDMYERLPTPYGLVRFGVAPDHLKIKQVTRVYARLASRPEVRFYGNVEIGSHLAHDDLRRHYHAVCYATGAATDRRLGIPGEELAGSHTATEFVAWYNGHPDYRDRSFDLDAERVAVVGVGNVAVDVARILCRSADELRSSDIAEHALEALARSRVREVYVLGRRGPLQAAFTTAEVKELGELPGAQVRVDPRELELDPLSRAELDRVDPKERRKVEILREFAARAPVGGGRTLVIRFLVSPVELVGDSGGRVTTMRLVRNELYRSEDGTLRPRATGQVEDLPVDLVFRSVGYRGVPIPGLPFEERRAVVPNDAGRVVEPETGAPIPGTYVSGWIKRGATGVIGTNKPDAGETVAALLEDEEAGRLPEPDTTDPAAVDRLLLERRLRFVTWQDWLRLDALELERGRAAGRPRVKFTSVEEMLAALDK